MTYDLGWWGNDPQNPATGEHSLNEYAVDAVRAWEDLPGTPTPNNRDWAFGPTWGNGTDVSLLGIGLPFYGRNISNGNAFTYGELKASGSTVDGSYYNYPGQASQVWIPSLDQVEDRVTFANERGLQNIIIWELAQDLAPTNANSMLKRAFETNQSLLPVPGDYDGDRTVGEGDFLLWKATYGFTEGDMRADGNEDGVIDGLDYAFWRNSMPTEPGGGGLAQVPEPASAVVALCAAGIAIVASRYPRRSRSA
jgi:hypothetical protein